MRLKRKKEVVIPIWDREDEYKALKAATDEARSCFLNYKGEDAEKKKALEAEWLKFQKLYEPLYAMREEWLDKTGVHPKAEQKPRMTRYEKLTFGATVGGMLLPNLWEQRGAIFRGAQAWSQRTWNLFTKAMKR